MLQRKARGGVEREREREGRREDEELRDGMEDGYEKWEGGIVLVREGKRLR